MVCISVSRYEDREGEAKSEYAKLHERYTDVSIFLLMYNLFRLTLAQLSTNAYLSVVIDIFCFNYVRPFWGEAVFFAIFASSMLIHKKLYLADE